MSRAAPAPDYPKHAIAHSSHASSLTLHSPVHHPFHGRYGATTYWDARCILAHRDVGSKRLFLIAWAGTDEKGQPWDPGFKKYKDSFFGSRTESQDPGWP